MFRLNHNVCPTFGDLARIRLKWSSTLFKKMSKESGYELTSRPQIISNGKWGEAESGRWRHVKRKALPTINLDVVDSLQGASIRTWIQCIWLWHIFLWYFGISLICYWWKYDWSIRDLKYQGFILTIKWCIQVYNVICYCLNYI